MRGRGVLSGGSVVCLLALGAPAPAVGQCYQGTRNTTKGERRFYVDTLGALKAAMPAPPPGWLIVEETDVRGPRAICVGLEREPLLLAFSVRYEPVGATAPGGDLRLVTARPSANASGSARIEVTVNERRLLFDDRVERAQEPETAFVFQRAAPGRTSLDLLLGDWSVFQSDDPSDPLEVMAHFDTDLPYVSVQTLSIRVAGPAQPVGFLRRQLDLAKLRALVHR